MTKAVSCLRGGICSPYKIYNMIYKIEVKNDKAAAFYQMLHSLRSMDIIESVEVLDASQEDEERIGEKGRWSESKGKNKSTQEMMKKYSDLVDLD